MNSQNTDCFVNPESEWLCHKMKDGRVFYRMRGINESITRLPPSSGIREEKNFNTHPEDTMDGWNDVMWSILIKKEADAYQTAPKAFSQDVQTNVTDLYNCYLSAYAFSSWVKDSDVLENLNWEVSKVYYNNKDDITKVKKIAIQREPVNIAMKRLYDKDKLQQLAGYSIGAYSESTPDELMPNIAIYCNTPVVYGDKQLDSVHVMNLIGYAFDSKEQPDYRYFVKNGILNVDELKLAYAKVWVYAFAAAHQHGLKNIQVFGVGAGAFRPDTIDEDDFLDEYVDNAIEVARTMVPHYAEGITTYREPEFFIPDGLFNVSENEIKNTLYVNAWDPWSMTGNGNKSDRSLDGYWGRSTAIGPLCWPVINQKISYEGIDM